MGTELQQQSERWRCFLESVNEWHASYVSSDQIQYVGRPGLQAQAGWYAWLEDRQRQGGGSCCQSAVLRTLIANHPWVREVPCKAKPQPVLIITVSEQIRILVLGLLVPTSLSWRLKMNASGLLTCKAKFLFSVSIYKKIVKLKF